MRNSIIVLAVLLLAIPGYAIADITGRVVDSFTRTPILGAIVTSNGDVTQTDEHGIFSFKTGRSGLAARAYGYTRAEVGSASQEIKLVPFRPKALYLSFFGIGDRTLRQAALKLIEQTELNAFVIDVKGDRGMLPYKSSVVLASEVGAQRIITIKDMNDLMKSLKERGVYTIARIVVFKDNPLALARHDLQVKAHSGEMWRDREELAWVDPFKKEVWDYNIDIAVEAAQHGFDEIQFDYVRFPDAIGLQYSMPNTEENRLIAISGFLTEARRRLESRSTLPRNSVRMAGCFGIPVMFILLLRMD